MEYKNYYDILEIKREEATEENIRRAFRRLARKYHPDVNPGNRESKERFIEVNEAFAVLGDAEKKRVYDAIKSEDYPITIVKQGVRIFTCYAHEDKMLLIQLEKHLQILQRQGMISLWHDRNITAGAEWEREIDTHLKSAQLILLLISPDFMASDYCYCIEMKQALERHERGEACVIPIILRPVYWQGAPFGKIQALPTDAIPIISSRWHNQDEAFFNVAEGIRSTIEKLK